ncbi:MAG TPA: DUF748 domain-containing protein [Steroidobacteraceae bacterium]|nr:DUF748 domain-containing protein [Steroidobacteraceae bacterium]
MTRRNKWLLTLAIIVVALIGFRLALPGIVKDVTNEKLQALDAYTGHIDQVHLALWRGGARVNGLRLTKRDSHYPEPFLQADQVDFSLEWRNVFRGKLVAEGEILEPKIHLVQSEMKQKQQMGTETDWRQTIQKLFPIRINTIRIRNGLVTFVTDKIAAKDAVRVQNINGEITNLTNATGSDEESFAHFNMSAQVLDDAPTQVSGTVNPLASSPTFDFDFKLENVKLPKLNPWLRQYIKADAEQGQFEIYMEMAAADGKFKGYAKPLMQDVKMLSSEDQDEGAIHKLWEGVVQFAANIFSNDKADEQVGARVPFSGTIKNPKAGIMATMVSVFHNAFVGAFAHSLEGSISLRDVKKNLSELNDDENPKDNNAKGEGKKNSDSKSKNASRDGQANAKKRG